MTFSNLPPTVNEALEVLFVEDAIKHRVLVLYFEGKPVNEICEELELKYWQVYRHLRAAKNWVKEYVHSTYSEAVSLED